MAVTGASSLGKATLPSPPKCSCPSSQASFITPQPLHKPLGGWARCSLVTEGALGYMTFTVDLASGYCSAKLVQHASHPLLGSHAYRLPSLALPKPALPQRRRALPMPAPKAFLESDESHPARLTQRDMSELSLRARLETGYYSQLGAGTTSTFGRYDILQRWRAPKESFGGSPPGGGKNNGRGRGDGGGGGGGEGEGQTAIYLLPVLTLVFAAVFLGYAVAVGLKEEGMNLDFLRTSAGLFGLLALAAFRVNNQTGIDAFILGLGASTAVMVWTGERFVVRKEIAPAGIVTLLAASMAVIFTGALYHSL